MSSPGDFVVLLAIVSEAYCYENEGNTLHINTSVSRIKNEVLVHENHFVSVSNVNLRKEVSRNKKNTTRDRKVC